MLSPVEKVERIYEAFYTGDLDGALTYCSTEVTMDHDPRLPWGGVEFSIDSESMLEVLDQAAAS
jgi:hypothetical protein